MRPMTLSTHAVPGHGRQTLSAQAAAAAAMGGKLQGRYGAAKSLDILRQNIQSLVNKEIDGILKKYLDKFFHPAIVNIRKNLGDDSVTEQSLRIVCIQMLDEAKVQYYSNPQTPYPINAHGVGKTTTYGNNGKTVSYVTKMPLPSVPNSDFSGGLSDFRVQYFQSQTSSSYVSKRKDTESECEGGKSRKKGLRTVTSILPGAPTPIKLVKLEGVRRDGPKWDPTRITNATLFIMGARANKVLGFGQTRGRLYTKHPELLKYSGDTEDKEWLSRNNLMPPTGGIAYLLLLEDIKELAESDDYCHNPNVLLHELKGFQAPDFMLMKIRTFIIRARTEGREDLSFQYYDPNLFLQGVNQRSYGVECSPAAVSSQQPLTLSGEGLVSSYGEVPTKTKQAVPALTALYDKQNPFQIDYF